MRITARFLYLSLFCFIFSCDEKGGELTNGIQHGVVYTRLQEDFDNFIDLTSSSEFSTISSGFTFYDTDGCAQSVINLSSANYPMGVTQCSFFSNESYNYYIIQSSAVLEGTRRLYLQIGLLGIGIPQTGFYDSDWYLENGEWWGFPVVNIYLSIQNTLDESVESYIVRTEGVHIVNNNGIISARFEGDLYLRSVYSPVFIYSAPVSVDLTCCN